MRPLKHQNKDTSNDIVKVSTRNPFSWNNLAIKAPLHVMYVVHYIQLRSVGQLAETNSFAAAYKCIIGSTRKSEEMLMQAAPQTEGDGTRDTGVLLSSDPSRLEAASRATKGLINVWRVSACAQWANTARGDQGVLCFAPWRPFILMRHIPHKRKL